MATNKMVNGLLSQLQRFSNHIDNLWNGLELCMAYQTASAPDPHAWTVCVCADDLDDMSERVALALVLKQLREQVEVKFLSMIERVVILHGYEPEKDELLSDLRAPEDSRLLIGRSILGREIVRAHIFILRPHLPSNAPARQTIRAS